MVITEVLIFLIVIFVAKYFWENRRFYYLAYKIPQCSLNLSLKNLYRILTADGNKLFHIVYEEAFNENEVCTKAWVGPFLFVAIYNPEDVKQVLNSKECLDKPFIIKFANLLKGSLFGDLDYWRSHRKLLNPYFGAKNLLNIIPIFNKKVDVLMENFKQLDGKGDSNVFYSMTALTLETILKVMDYDVNIQNQKIEIKRAFIENTEKFLEIIAIRLLQPWFYVNCIFNCTNLSKTQEKVFTASGMGFAKDVIKNAKNLQEKEENNEKSKSFIRALVDPKYNFSEEEMHHEISTVLIAAQDTSAIASSTTLMLLGMHKEIQQKVVDELHGLFGKTLEAPYLDIEKINELHYLEMVINETMRLIPIVPYILRINSSDIEISDEYIIPAKSFIAIPIIILHRSKKIWGEDADEFRPERFEKENIEKIPSYAYIPFAKGPRMCIGWRYAMLLMKIQLAKILLRYEIDTNMKLEDVDFHFHITMNSVQGYKISLKERKID